MLEIRTNYCRVEDGILVWAVRYALGRRTYAVSETCDAVTNNINNLRPKIVQVMIRDINEQEQKYGLGDQCDIDAWHELRDRLQAVL